MRIERPTALWLVTPGEPLPLDGGDVRLLRTGILFEDLCERGLRVDWWTAGFDHANRRHRARELERVQVGETGRIILVPSPGYGRSVSPRRLLDHRVIARRFAAAARDEDLPDVIYCSFPTIALSRAAVAFGLRTNTPVVLDIRDLWPDVIWDSVLPSVSGLPREAALLPMRRSAGWAVRNAAGVIGMTDEYVDWALAMAGKPRGPLDVGIPVTYPAHEPVSDAERGPAAAFWRERGVDLEEHWIACFLGTMGRQFDFGPVAEAARALRASDPELRLVLCGEGDGFAALKAATADLPNICLPGWVDGPPRKLLLERSRVGLAPYLPSENFRRNLPNKPVEYFAHGLPVLHPIEGVLDRICSEGPCGLRYGAPGGPDLGTILQGLRADEGRLQALSSSARARFEQNHRPEKVTDLVLAHREAVLAAR